MSEIPSRQSFIREPPFMRAGPIPAKYLRKRHSHGFWPVESPGHER